MMNTPTILLKIKELLDSHPLSNPFSDGLLYHPTGSAYTCNPPVTDTDEDWICYTDTGEPWRIQEALEKDGFVTSEDQGDYPDCISYRKGNVNIVVVFEAELYYNWVKATEVCKYLNLMEKQDRKMVHRIICGEQIDFDNGEGN